jgi:hypothetical protein
LNDRAVELRGSTAAITLPEVWLNGQWAALSASQANRVGEAERGVPFAARLRMRATAGEPEAPVWQGAGFRLESQGGGEYRLEADTAANGMREGQLTVSGRSYRVQVFVYEPAPPKPALRLSGASLEFGRQEQVEVVLAETARGSASGQLTVTFEPEAAGVKDDATVGWMPGLTRTVSFTVTPGAAKAQFGSAEFVTLQTGTTAGTLTITATLGGQKDEKRVRLAPAGPALQTATVQRGDRQVTLRVTGYDPMRDTRKAAFTFYLVNGQTAQPGRMEADVSGAFRGYFAESGVTSGAFVLNVQFPVTGTVSELGSVEMELANGIGAVKTQRLAIQ